MSFIRKHPPQAYCYPIDSKAVIYPAFTTTYAGAAKKPALSLAIALSFPTPDWL
jgi:hypothetical protein